jgi:hypothetical protein
VTALLLCDEPNCHNVATTMTGRGDWCEEHDRAAGKPWLYEVVVHDPDPQVQEQEILCPSCAAHTPALPITAERAREIECALLSDPVHCGRCQDAILPALFTCAVCAAQESPRRDAVELGVRLLCQACYDRTPEGRADHDADGGGE